jgi:hypothetical protein
MRDMIVRGILDTMMPESRQRDREAIECGNRIISPWLEARGGMETDHAT